MTRASAPEPTRGTTARDVTTQDVTAHEIAAPADTTQADTAQTDTTTRVAAQVTVQLEGQLSINDVLLELGEAPVVVPYPDADAGDTNFF